MPIKKQLQIWRRINEVKYLPIISHNGYQRPAAETISIKRSKLYDPRGQKRI